MKILALIISILKILGIILLIILALILLIILILLFSKIKIDLDAKFFENIALKFKASYLFGILKYRFDYEKNEHKLIIFGKNIFKNEKKQKKRKTELKKSNNESNKNKLDIKKHYKKEPKEKTIKEFNKTFDTDFEDEKSNYENIKENTEDFNKKKSLKEKINKEIIKELIMLMKKLIKSFNFKKIKINLSYGFEEPYTTGKTCAIISIILPAFSKKYIKNINLIPNFQEKELEGEAQLKIRTTLFKLLLPILFFIFNKNIRKIIFQKGD